MRRATCALIGCLLGGCHVLLPLAHGTRDDSGHDGAGDGSSDVGRDALPGDGLASEGPLFDGVSLDGPQYDGASHDGTTVPDTTAPPPDLQPTSDPCSGTWQVFSPPPDPGDDLNAIWCSSATSAAAAGDYGLLLQFNGTWDRYTTTPANAFSDVWGSGTGTVVAAGFEEIWSLGSLGWALDHAMKNSLVFFKGLWGLSASDVYVVGSSSTFLHYNGTKWSSVTSNFPGTDLRAVWGTSATNLYVVADQGTIYHFDGQTPTPVFTGTADLKDIWGFGSSDIYAVGTGGAVVHFDGQTWALHPKATGLGLRAVWGSVPNRVFAVGDSGTAICFNGQSWQPVATPPGTPVLNDVRGCGSGTVFAVGPYATVLTYVTP